MTRHIYRHADAVVAYGEHVRRFVAGIRGRDDDVFVAPQAVEPELFAREVERLLRSRRVPRPPRAAARTAGALRGAPGGREGSRGAGPRPGRRLVADATLVVIGDGPLSSLVASLPAGAPARPPGSRRAAGRLPRRRAGAAAVGAHPAVHRALGTGLQRGDAPGPPDGGHQRGRRRGRRAGPRRRERARRGARRRRSRWPRAIDGCWPTRRCASAWAPPPARPSRPTPTTRWPTRSAAPWPPRSGRRPRVPETRGGWPAAAG